MSLPRLLSASQVAVVLQCSPTHVRGLIAKGALLAVNIAVETEAKAAGEKVPRPRWVVPEAEVTAFLVARGLVTSDAIFETDATGATVETAATRKLMLGSRR